MYDFSNVKILIGTPAYGGQCYTGYTESLLYTMMLLSQYNIQVQVKFINNQLVTRARNMISSIFMEDDSFTHLLFIDADIKWSPEYVLMLLEHQQECCIGVYPNKQYYKNDGQLILKPSSLIIQPHIEKGNYLIKVKHGATGFMLIKKSAFYKIQKDIDIFYLPGSNGENVQLYNYFDCKVIDNDYLTEDFYFSYLLNKNGGDIWADKRIKLLHIGTHQYGELI